MYVYIYTLLEDLTVHAQAIIVGMARKYSSCNVSALLSPSSDNCTFACAVLNVVPKFDSMY